MIGKSVVFPAVFCLLLTGVCGCTAPLALLGLGSAAPVAFNSSGRGKGDSSWLARYDDVVQATLHAGQVLSLKLEKEVIGKDQTVFLYIDGKGNKLEVMIERRTETMTYARFDVGLFGSKSMGQLMVRQIIFEMTQADNFIRDWNPAGTD